MAGAWWDGSVAVVRASAYGSCIRAISAELAGYQGKLPDDAAEIRMGEGNLHEPDILRRIGDEFGWYTLNEAHSVTVLQHRQVSYSIDTDESGKNQFKFALAVLPNLRTTGHTDGFARSDGHEERVVEAKAFSDGWFKKWEKEGWEAFQRYAYQLSIYMHATTMPGLMAVKNRNTGKIVIELVDEPLVSIAQLKARGAMVMAGAHPARLPDCSQESDWLCPFKYLHVADGPTEPSEAIPAAQAMDFDQACKRWQELKKAENEIDDELDILRKSFFGWVDLKTDQKSLTSESDGYKLTLSWRNNTQTDFDAMRADGVDVEQYQHTTRSKVPRVTKKGAKK
jgi:hypothetical protein